MANATPNSKNNAVNYSISRYLPDLAAVDSKEVSHFSNEVELLFTEYISQDSSGIWYITEAEHESNVNAQDLAKNC